MRNGVLWRRIWRCAGRMRGNGRHSLRAVFNGLRYIVKTGNQWWMMPHDLPPWPVVYQQTQRWIRAGCFEIIVEDLRSLLREFAGRNAKPTAMILDSRTVQSTPESGARAGYDGAKRRKGSKVHAAVDTLGHLLALHGTAADQQDRAQVEQLAAEVQRITEQNVELAYVDQGYTGQAAVSGWKSSNIQKQSAASSYCPDVGWWNGASPGPPASEDSPGITNASPRPSPDTTTSPSLGLCSPTWPIYSVQLHNSL